MDIYFAQYPKFKRFRHEKLPFCAQLKVLLENRLATGSYSATQIELELDDSDDENRDEDLSSGDEEGRTQNSTRVGSRATSRPATNARKR